MMSRISAPIEPAPIRPGHPQIFSNGGLASEPKYIRMACKPRRIPTFRSIRETCADLRSDVHNNDGHNNKRDRDA